MTDHEIIDHIRSGNTQAFQQLVERHQEMVFRTALGFVHVKEEAEDIAQEVFLSVFRSLNQFGGQAEFSTWLYRIVVNTSLNQVRKKRRQEWLQSAGDALAQLFDRATDDRNPEQNMLDEELDQAVRQAIDSLSEKQRTALVLQKYDELSQREIAVVMQISEGAVEQHLQRARLNLQKKLAHLVGK